MGASKWLLLFACIYTKASKSDGSRWTSKYPASVKGLLSSCVVIPCSFNYPDEGNKHDSTGIWKDPNGIVFHSQTPQKVLQQYRNRIELVGNLKEKNCSMKIDPLQESDTGPFTFRIEIKNFDNYSYNNKVSISVQREPNPVLFFVGEDIKDGQNVSASCSVYHSCPASPPRFKWSHSGEIYQSQQLEIANSEWKETSILSFRPTHTDHNKPLRCTITYKGGKQQQESKILQVKYAPVNVQVEYKSNVTEGETVYLTCSSEAHPPVSRYEWHNDSDVRISEGNLYKVSNVSRNNEAIYCTAINEEGRRKSNPVRLNVLYAPEVKTESSCSSDGNWIKFECVVDSNPPSSVTFKLADQIIGPKMVENSSSIIKVPWKDFESSKFVLCWAENVQGNASLKLFLPHDGTMLYIFIAAGAAGLLLIILLAVAVKKCRGTPSDTLEMSRSTIITQGACEPPQNASKRKEICDDPHYSNICPNKNIYGNIGMDWDDQIYSNL